MFIPYIICNKINSKYSIQIYLNVFKHGNDDRHFELCF